MRHNATHRRPAKAGEFKQTKSWAFDPWPVKVLGQVPQRPWLQTRGSLTAQLRATYSPVQVHPRQQGWVRLHPAEQRVLSLPARQRVWQREVSLTGAGVPRVFAHSVISAQTLSGPWHRLRQLGQRPLGELLFNTTTVKRSPLTFKKLPRLHPLRLRIVAAGLAAADTPLWARRSRYQLGRGMLMVTEVFLPACGQV